MEAFPIIESGMPYAFEHELEMGDLKSPEVSVQPTENKQSNRMPLIDYNDVEPFVRGTPLDKCVESPLGERGTCEHPECLRGREGRESILIGMHKEHGYTVCRQCILFFTSTDSLKCAWGSWVRIGEEEDGYDHVWVWDPLLYLAIFSKARDCARKSKRGLDNAEQLRVAERAVDAMRRDKRISPEACDSYISKLEKEFDELKDCRDELLLISNSGGDTKNHSRWDWLCKKFNATTPNEISRKLDRRVATRENRLRYLQEDLFHWVADKIDNKVRNLSRVGLNAAGGQHVREERKTDPLDKESGEGNDAPARAHDPQAEALGEVDEPPDIHVQTPSPTLTQERKQEICNKLFGLAGHHCGDENTVQGKKKRRILDVYNQARPNAKNPAHAARLAENITEKQGERIPEGTIRSAIQELLCQAHLHKEHSRDPCPVCKNLGIDAEFWDDFDGMVGNG